MHKTVHKIICKQVPETLLKREAAKNHFRKFGSVKRIVLRTVSRNISVEYGGEEAIEKVLKHGNVYDDKKFVISRDTSVVTEKKQSKKEKSTIEHLNISDEVMKELDAMGGGPSLALVNKSNVRREVVNRDKLRTAAKRRVPVDKEKVIIKKNKSIVFPKNKDYQELLEIIYQPAHTIEEKYKVLDARDKILRILRKQNGASDGFMKGTCPDMCPEKERLLRVIQHQVSHYEQNSYRELDPSLAMKQYSRSSADQESPLPHELRPVKVLRNTMLHLIHKIMPQIDSSNVNVADWYHFIWDRTRSIRKDITQQELCCPRAVELIEQCARFHIYCSSRLVAEDPSVFDQKINTENLTKCLQTLKYLYHDLRLKQQNCPNEAEFRAYIIHLNLNDGNFLWEVQRLPSDIKSSPQVKEAMQIYFALNSNNYVKFFKFVRSTSYLNASILMRYFMQVRIRAIDVMLKSFTPRVMKAVYPLETLKLNLGFETIDHTVEFLQTCGLEIDDSKTQVTLDKSAFVTPDLTYTALDRSINLVESKRGDLSVGEVVYGGKLPSFELHLPKSSFNGDGILEKQSFTEGILEQSYDEKSSDETQEMIDLSSEDAAGSSEIRSTDQDDGASYERSIFTLDETDGDLSTISVLPIKTDHDNGHSSKESIFNILPATANVGQDIFGNKMVKNIFGDKRMNLDEIKPKVEITNTEEEPERVQEFPETRNYLECSPKHRNTLTPEPMLPNHETSSEESDDEEVGVSIYQQFFTNGNEEESEIESPRKETKKESIECEVEGLLTEVVDEVAKKVTAEKLENLRSRIQKRMLTKFVTKWRQYVHKKERERTAFDMFLARSVPATLEEGAAAYGLPSYIIDALQNKPLKKSTMWDYEEKETKADMLNFAKILNERYRSLGVKKNPIDQTLKIYWKCIISLPQEAKYCHHTAFLKKSVDKYLDWKNSEHPLIVQEFAESNVVRLCFTKETGIGDSKNDANALIFVGRYMNSDLYERILNKFLTTGINCSVPIVVILEDPSKKDKKLDALVEQGIISGYRIISSYKDIALEKLLEKALYYLMEKATAPPPIMVNYMKNVLFKNYLCSESWKKITCSIGSNWAFRGCLTNPNVVFGLYNDGLKRLKEIVLDKSCYEYGRFPQEFREFEESPEDYPFDYRHLPEFGEDEEYKNSVSKIFDYVMPIQSFSRWPPKNHADLEDIVYEFSVLNFGISSSEFCQKLFYNLQKKVNDDLTQLKNILWTEALDVIFAEKFRVYEEFLNYKMPDSWHFYNSLLVVYHTASMESFLSMEWLNVAHPIIKKELRYDVGFDDSFTDKDFTDEEDCYESINREIKETIARTERFLTHNGCDFDFIAFDQEMKDLSSSVTVSKKVTSKFQEHFEEIMKKE